MVKITRDAEMDIDDIVDLSKSYIKKISEYVNKRKYSNKKLKNVFIKQKLIGDLVLSQNKAELI